MTLKQRERHWREILGRYASSGMTRKAFCEAEGISRSGLGYQFKKMNRARSSAAGDTASSPFLEIRSAVRPEAEPSQSLELRWSSGLVLRAGAAFPAHTLIRLARELSSKC